MSGLCRGVAEREIQIADSVFKNDFFNGCFFVVSHETGIAGRPGFTGMGIK